MSQPTNLRGVLDNDLCIACGACVAADPSLELKLHPDKLIFEPTGVGNQRAADVCPAVQVDFPRLQGLLFPGSEQGPTGSSTASCSRRARTSIAPSRPARVA